MCIENAVHEFWGELDHPAHATHFEEVGSLIYVPRGLRLQHIYHIRHIHFYGSEYMLIGGLRFLLNSFPFGVPLCCFQPTTIEFTMRYMSWLNWNWGMEPSLYKDGMKVCEEPWPKSIKEFIFEFESWECFSEYVDNVAETAKRRWKIPLRDGAHLSAEGSEIEVMRWQGSHSKQLKDMWLHPPVHLFGQGWKTVTTLNYYVRKVKFQRVEKFEQVRSGSSRTSHLP